MARDGSGTMTILNSFTSATTISSSATNANNTDIASEITGSLPIDGQKAMSGQFKAASGTVSAPGMSFSSDTNSGWYPIGSDNLGLALGGSKVLDVATTGLGVTGTLSASGVTNLADGTVSLPGLTWTSDPDSGWYRIGANNIGCAVNGAKVLDVGTAGLGVTGTLSSTGAATLASATVTGAATLGSIAGAAVATQADMETGTSTATAVSPGRQHFHPGHLKAWAFVAQGTTAIVTDFGCASVSDDGVGFFTLTFDTAFSATGAYTCTGGYARAVADSSASMLVVSSSSSATKTTTTFKLQTTNVANSDADSVEVGVSFSGDQ